jgi:nucleotide-binding universal stress UspA family protein
MAMEKLQKFLVPLDGSECAENIIPRIEKLAIDGKAHLCLLRVVYAHTFPGIDPTEAQVAVVHEAEAYLQKVEQRLKDKGLSVDSHVRYGNDAEEILDHAAKRKVDLIAMSTHGRGGVKRWLLGSVAEKILRHATTPIFLVRCS